MFSAIYQLMRVLAPFPWPLRLRIHAELSKHASSARGVTRQFGTHTHTEEEEEEEENKTKQNKTKQNKTKRNETKQNETNQNKTDKQTKNGNGAGATGPANGPFWCRSRA